MGFRLYNSLTHGLEDFEPITPGVVRMYNCGPTVYDFAHIGNFRSFLTADLLRRAFEFAGLEVIQVMNITDVGHMTEDNLADGGGDDKMQKAVERMKEAKKAGRAEVDDPNDPYQVADYFTRVFIEDARALRLKVAEEFPSRMPKATEHVEAMVRMIGRLIEREHAYVSESGAVYYDVTSFPEYGRLSGNTLDRLRAGASTRLDEGDQAGKRHPADFLLWKPDARHLMKWDSPWGVGYPGWHIECSAMALGLHGVDTIDIHTGGEDNIFPHHECEIAQSNGATGQPFARFWLHARFLMVEGEKMSKSKGNFYTARDLFQKGVEPSVLRLELMRTHYRKNMNFTVKGLEDSGGQVRRLRRFAATHPQADPNAAPAGSTDIEREFLAALQDDLNISDALGRLNAWLGAIQNPRPEDVAALKRMDCVLGVLEADAAVEPTSEGLGDQEIEAMCRQIDDARAAKDYGTSDRLRDRLNEAGIEVQISRDGTTWRRRVTL